MKIFLKRALTSNKGVALITVILLVSVLVALAIELNRSARADIYDAANISDGIKLAYIAKSGFYGAAVLLLNADSERATTLFEDWANTEALSVRSREFFDNGYFVVRVEDEMGKIPLNKLAENAVLRSVLIRLLGQPEFGLDRAKAEEIVAAIKDWVDEDNDLTSGGAESPYYMTLDPPYRAKNAPLDCIEELLMVKGITKEIFAGTKEKPALADFVTADGDGLININTAPLLVLRSLSDAITPTIAQQLDEHRRKNGNDLSSVTWFADIVGGTIDTSVFTASSNYFKIISAGKMNKMEQKIAAIIARDGKSAKILKWRVD